MSSKKTKETVSSSEATVRRNELVNDLVKFRVSLDPNSIKSGKGPVQLRREIRALGRAANVNTSKK
ncbi:MAG: hypothetical protein RIR26_1910 [Pseudomonadota bacterium]|jgi:hypothetical protein